MVACLLLAKIRIAPQIDRLMCFVQFMLWPAGLVNKYKIKENLNLIFSGLWTAILAAKQQK